MHPSHFGVLIVCVFAMLHLTKMELTIDRTVMNVEYQMKTETYSEAGEEN